VVGSLPKMVFWTSTRGTLSPRSGCLDKVRNPTRFFYTFFLRRQHLPFVCCTCLFAALPTA
jgi:hypothetical protein